MSDYAFPDNVVEPTPATSTVPETIYVALNNGRSVQVTQVYGSHREHVPFYDGEVFRDTLDASFVGAGAVGEGAFLLKDIGAAETVAGTPGTPNTLTVSSSGTVVTGAASLPVEPLDTEAGKLIAQSDEALHQIPRLSQKCRTRITYLRKTKDEVPVELLFRWFWEDEIKGIGDAAPL